MPKNVPIFFVHCKQDRLTPHEGALAAYQKLIDAGHKHSYLISVDVLEYSDPNNLDLGHIDVLSEQNNAEHFNGLRSILSYYKVLPSECIKISDLESILSNYRSPSHLLNEQNRAEYLKNITTLNTLENKEKWVKRFGTCLYAMLYTSVGTYILYKLGIIEKIIGQLRSA